MYTDRPLVLMTDDALLEQVQQFAAAAGCELDRVFDLVAARRRWGDAPLVLLDAAAVHKCLRATLPRRPGVVVLSTTEREPDFWRQALEMGVEHVLTLPVDEAKLLAAFEDAAERPATVAGRVVAIVGGRGGAGASVLAAATALTALNRGNNVLLVDGDPYGGGLDLVLGIESDTGIRWPALHEHSGRLPAAFRSALPGRSAGDARLSVVSCDRDGPGPEPDAMAAVIDAGRRIGDTVICDVPRQLSDAARVALQRADLAVLVVPAELRACAAARRVAEAIREHGVRLHTLVRGPAPGGLPAAEVARAVDTPLLAAVRAEPFLDRSLERGPLRPRPRGPLSTAATAILTAVPTRTDHRNRP